MGSSAMEMGATGVFKNTDYTSFPIYGNITNGYFGSLDFNASLSAVVCGKSTTVQPPAIYALIMIKA